MSPRLPFAGAGCAALLVAGGCALSPSVTAPDVPASLRPPAGQVVFLEALASGVQIYDCALKPDGSGAHGWVFRAPEATLSDRAGGALGTHYAGPTWAGPDGSTVVAEVAAREAAPMATAIPWLLLSAKSVTGAGLFGKTTSIQRVHTVGGAAPATPCGPDNAGQQARMHYTAAYYFYRAGP
ncbi:DUF3455 domain-containing protein [Rhizobacter sp. Root1221]|uniref:DUF3455 domain-containing protein n=1 Tax=Rhizobacter sp. Root1221 TaxID=1736433 RepID=UPI0006FD7398|nr:DUF3455 domain-containing protein [Rhizobacter sp. Root1221]KQV91728.1 hypothetical protein ASC87_06535 [Rhizobacter sp. Root1221]